jgi:NAD(P)H-hydrate epimerase
LKSTDHVVDAIFGKSVSRVFGLYIINHLPSTGFSFSGEVREPFSPVIEALEKTSVPVTSVDAPSSWNIESGPPKDGPGKDFNPAALVSLTAPKPLVAWFRGRHFLGGR